MNNLHLKIITPTNTLFNQEIDSVDLPGEKGRFTVLKNHGNIISLLSKGVITINDLKNKTHSFKCNKGSVECLDNKLIVLLEDGELVE